MTTEPKSTEDLQRELLELQIAEERRRERAHIAEIQARLRRETEAARTRLRPRL